jgi:hypothetical protein
MSIPMARSDDVVVWDRNEYSGRDSGDREVGDDDDVEGDDVDGDDVS